MGPRGKAPVEVLGQCSPEAMHPPEAEAKCEISEIFMFLCKKNLEFTE